ncbi:hypothetical protein [Vulgatibacter incomptus]|uniref:Lipoprotein n=1 Tax=Vulgatibacter incomptus TaxID=1391653 RepID=A0A0K1PBQ7_9BACT|nr:hypothetical protein [Vulgatibacter incomptus]AKU90932.1 hypothetical protein AKJ08_1319 [Vulgatibacter incomptus]
MRALCLQLCTLVLAATACESSVALQLVTAEIDPRGFRSPPVEVVARSGDRLVASAPIDPDRSFLLAVPPGEQVMLALVDESGADLAPIQTRPSEALVLRICRPDPEPVDLGRVRLEKPDCPPPPRCSELRGALDRCLELEDDEVCDHCPPDDRCDDERRELDRCLRAGAGCNHPPGAVAQRSPPEPGIGCEPSPPIP